MNTTHVQHVDKSYISQMIAFSENQTWEMFIKHGSDNLKYMIDHFNDMIDNNKIKHFDIIDGIAWLNLAERLKTDHIEKIQEDLISWLHTEYSSGELIKNVNWKPFQDYLDKTSCYFAYRKMF